MKSSTALEWLWYHVSKTVELVLIGFGDKTKAKCDLRNNSKTVTYYKYHPYALFELQPYRDLPVAVIGIKQGLLQIVNLKEGYKVYQKPLTFETTTMQELLDLCQKIPPAKMPRNLYKYYKEGCKWQTFQGWKHAHWMIGDAYVDRIHIFFRPIREHPTGCNLVTEGKNINFVNRSHVEFYRPYNNKLEHFSL